MSHPNSVLRTAKSEEDVDLALAVMCAMQSPGECFSYQVIAAVTGMSHGGPCYIEREALKKLRKRVRHLMQ